MKFYLIVIFAILLISCARQHSGRNYPQNPQWSTKDGWVGDSIENYSPKLIIRDNEVIYNTPRSPVLFENGIYPGVDGGTLSAAKEPVLWNFYLGHDICRFMWYRAFDLPLIFSLHRDEDHVWLTVKKLDSKGEFERMSNYYLAGKLKIGKDADTNRFSLTYFPDSIILKNQEGKKVIKRTNIILNKTIQLSLVEWEKFTSLLDSAQFGNLETNDNDLISVDGSCWYIEMHLQTKYWLVGRCNPKGYFRKCGEYLIRLSGVNEEIY